MLKPNEDKSAYDFINEKSGEIYKNACPYFEGKEVCGYLNADNKIDDYELIVYVNDLGAESYVTIPLQELFAQNNKIAALAKRGLIIQPYVAKDAFALLQADAQELKRHSTIKHTRLGLTSIDGQYVYLQEQNTVGTVKYQYDGKIKLHKGIEQDYEEFLQSAVFKSRNLTLAYMIGMSAPVVSLLKENGLISDKTVVINFSGQSSTGKSTSARLALSPFGNPSFNRDGLGITHNTTDNALYDALDGVHGMPRVLDDINQNGKLNMDTLIYSIASSEAKRRMGKKYQGTNVGWGGTVIATTETPVILDTAQKGGVQARILTLEMQQWTSSKEEAELINNVVQKHYGCMGEDFVAQLLNDIDYLEERFEEIRNEVDSKITVRDSLTGRISAQIAAIALTVDCYLKYYPNAFEWSYLDLIEPLITGEERMVGVRDAGEKILDIVKEYSTTNAVQFDKDYITDKGYHLYQPYYAIAPVGKITNMYDSVTHDLIRQVISIYNNSFNSLMLKYNVNDRNAGLNILKSRGQLQTDKDGHLTKKVNGVRAYCFIVHIPNEPNDNAGC